MSKFIVIVFYVGYLCFVSGIWGFLIGVFFVLIIQIFGGFFILVVVIVFVFVIGWWVIVIMMCGSDNYDFSEVVVDEVVG